MGKASNKGWCERRTARRGRHRASGAGYIASVEMMLVVTLLAIGGLVGLQAVRTAVITELADIGGAIGSTSQTYSWSGTRGHHASANGALWQDAGDSCEAVQSITGSQGGVNSRCVAICELGGGLTDATPEDAAPLAENPLP